MRRGLTGYLVVLVMCVLFRPVVVFGEEWKKSYLLKCVPNSVKELSLQGEIKDASSLSVWLKTYRFTIDIQSGIFRNSLDGSSKGEQVHILQIGDEENDTVFSVYDDKQFNYFIRIRDWASRNKDPVTFLWVNYSTLISGICEKIQ